MCLYVLSSVLWCPLRFPHKNDVRFVFISSCHVLFTLFVFVCIKWFSTQWHIVLYFLFCFTSSCVPYHMLPVSLDCLFLISPWVFSSLLWAWHTLSLVSQRVLTFKTAVILYISDNYGVWVWKWYFNVVFYLEACSH